METIETYANDLLAPRLRNCGVPKDMRRAVCLDVVQRLISLASHWSDPRFRKIALLLGSEEAGFWEPLDASLEVRCLVLLGIRNSLVEDLHFDPHDQSVAISDPEMRDLTQEAINFFSNQALATPPTSTGLWAQLPQQFPNAWQRLDMLAHAVGADLDCTLPLQKSKPLKLSPTGLHVVRRQTVTISGISPEFDTGLVNILRSVQQGQLRLFNVPSFSRLTRNPVKLMAIIEHIVKHGTTLITANYVLSANYLAARTPLLRSPHDSREVELNFNNSIGLSPRHRALLATS